jgi:hypothetical protein
MKPRFAKNAIDAEILPKLTAEDVKELSVARVGHRRKLLAAIADLSGWKRSKPFPLPAAHCFPPTRNCNDW